MDTDYSSEEDKPQNPFGLNSIDTEEEKSKPAFKSEAPNANILNRILKPFKTCCASYKPTNRPSSPVDLIATGNISVSETSSTTNDDPEQLEFREYHDYFKSSSNVITEEINKAILEQHGYSWSDLPSTRNIDSNALWNITIPLQTLFTKTDYYLIETAYFPMICFHWCLHLEGGERTDVETLIKLINSSKNNEASKDINANNVRVNLKKFQTSGLFNDVKEVKTRLIEEIIGQLYTLVDSAISNPDICVYMIITHARSIAISCHSQRDLLSLKVFDTGLTKERGPAILGFDSPKTAESYVLDLYNQDPSFPKVNQSFLTWTFHSQSGSKSPKNESVDYSNYFTKKSSSLTNSEDPVTNVLKAVTHATNTKNNDELVFTQNAAGNLHVSAKKK